jgi:uncharacterized protein (TIGR00269 family)
MFGGYARGGGLELGGAWDLGLTWENALFGETDVIEIRPVISGGAGNRMKCRRCKAPAVVEIRRHNAAFCAECFLRHVREQVKRAIEAHDMFGPTDRILVAVSGGKDSLALWDVLLELGYLANGLYLGLGIGVTRCARGRPQLRTRATRLVEVDLARTAFNDNSRKGLAVTCAVRAVQALRLNRAAEGGCDVIATGATSTARPPPCSATPAVEPTTSRASRPAARGGDRAQVKPLYRLSELETAAFAFLRGIDYVVEECPLVGGNTQLRYKDAMNQLESTSPGTKAQFFLGYLDRAAPLFATQDDVELVGCERCGQPTTGRFCAFCRAQAQILGALEGPHGGSPAPDDGRASDGSCRSRSTGAPMIGPFEAGEKILLVDQRGRRYLLTLQTGETWHSHGGGLSHDLLIGSAEGTLVHSATGMAFRAFRPRMADFVLKMPRGAQLVYPKDVGAILVGADVFPGSRVLEAGTGSGSLTLALCRATGAEGRVVSYDLRPDFQAGAARNIESFFGKVPDWLELRGGDVREIAGGGEIFDRAILDLPEPWDTLEPLADVLPAGAIFCGYLPTTNQVQQLCFRRNAYEHLRRSGAPLVARDRSGVRPDHRMAHLGSSRWPVGDPQVKRLPTRPYA